MSYSLVDVDYEYCKLPSSGYDTVELALVSHCYMLPLALLVIVVSACYQNYLSVLQCTDNLTRSTSFETVFVLLSIPN